MIPAAMPPKKAPFGPMKPAIGVIVAKPAIEAVHVPKTDALPNSLMSHNVHVTAAVAAAICVAMHANAPLAPADNAEPPLNPNQPTHNIAVPKNVSTKFPTVISISFLLPTLIAATNAPIPAVMCTTMPPAKSKTPKSAK